MVHRGSSGAVPTQYGGHSVRAVCLRGARRAALPSFPSMETQENWCELGLVGLFPWLALVQVEFLSVVVLKITGVLDLVFFWDREHWSFRKHQRRSQGAGCDATVPPLFTCVLGVWTGVFEHIEPALSPDLSFPTLFINLFIFWDRVCLNWLASRPQGGSLPPQHKNYRCTPSYTALSCEDQTQVLALLYRWIYIPDSRIELICLLVFWVACETRRGGTPLEF